MPARGRLLPWISLLVVWTVWGSTYLAIRVVVREMPPFAAAGLRFLAAGIVMAVLAFVLNRRDGWPTKRQWIDYSVIGVLLLGVGNALVMWSEKTIPSGIAALIVATVPVWIVLLDGLRPGGQPWTARVWAGTIVGLVGRGARGPARRRPRRRPLEGDPRHTGRRPRLDDRLSLHEVPFRAPARAHRGGGGDARGRGIPRPGIAARRRGPGPDRHRLERRLGGARLPRRLRLARRLHRLRLLPGRAARPHGRHVRVREPGGRGGAGRAHPRRAALRRPPDRRAAHPRVRPRLHDVGEPPGRWRGPGRRRKKRRPERPPSLSREDRARAAAGRRSLPSASSRRASAARRRPPSSGAPGRFRTGCRSAA